MAAIFLQLRRKLKFQSRHVVDRTIELMDIELSLVRLQRLFRKQCKYIFFDFEIFRCLRFHRMKSGDTVHLVYPRVSMCLTRCKFIFSYKQFFSELARLISFLIAMNGLKLAKIVNYMNLSNFNYLKFMFHVFVSKCLYDTWK